MKIFIKLLLGIGSIFLLFSYSPYSKKKVIKYYFLLDRNSQTITYKGDTNRFTPVKTGYFYISPTEDHIIAFEIGNESYRSEELRKKYVKQEPVKKPLRFLDSIKYYNEDWVRYNLKLSFFSRSDPNIESKFFVIDEASVNNDSLYVYQVGIIDIYCD